MQLRTITYIDSGYILNIPVLEQTHFVEWDSIETIIFGPEIIYRDHSEFIIYLNKPPIIKLTENAWWLNKLNFWLTIKSRRKIRMSDEWNKGFSEFINNAKTYLKNVKDVDIARDRRKGKLINSKNISEGNKNLIEQNWIPQKSTNYKWEMVYDKYSRSIEEIYNRDQGI